MYLNFNAKAFYKTIRMYIIAVFYFEFLYNAWVAEPKRAKLSDKMLADNGAPGDKVDPTKAGLPDDHEESDDGPGLKIAREPNLHKDPADLDDPKGKKPGRGRKKPKLPVELAGDGGDPTRPNQDDEDVSSHVSFHHLHVPTLRGT